MIRREKRELEMYIPSYSGLRLAITVVATVVDFPQRRTGRGSDMMMY